MPSLEADFDALTARLRDPQPRGSDPFYYFVYPPEQALTVKEQLPIWTARLRNLGLTVERVALGELLWQVVDASGHWPIWLEFENGADQQDVNESVRDALRIRNALVDRVATALASPRPNTVVFLTEAELLHPYFRVRSLESALHDRIKAPTVVLYPGRRAGQFGLHFLGFYPEDSNYRATLIGGLP